jgi:uncharacterized membrane protein YhaH (DUF805 family)
MEQNSQTKQIVTAQPVQNPITNTTPAIPTQHEPRLLLEKPKPGYFTRLFSGRMNRQNYIIGSTVLVILPLLCFLVVIFKILLSPSTFAMPYLNPLNPGQIVMPQVSITSLLLTPGNELWTGLGIVFFVLSIPYLFSVQIKRLHDLNLTGWLWIINFLPLFFLKQMLSLSDLTNPNIWSDIGNFVSLVAAVFSIYVTVWPGTNGPNNYGDPPLSRSSFLKDVMEI